MTPASELRPFVDRPVGDVAAATAAARAAAEDLGLPAPVAVRVGMNALFRSGDVILRVGRPSAPGHLSLELADSLLQLGINVPVPADPRVFRRDGLTTTCWRAIEPTDRPVDWVAVGAAVRQVHRLSATVVPGGYPVPSPAAFPWWDFDALLADVGSEVDAPALAGIEAAIDRHRGWEAMADEDVVICHGDVHPGNVMMTADGPVLLDWDLMCRAVPAWDHAMLLTLAERWAGSTAVYPAFASGYGESLANDPSASALAELRNVAATLLRLRAGRTNPAAHDEARRRLRFWRGESDAPAWAAQ